MAYPLSAYDPTVRGRLVYPPALAAMCRDKSRPEWPNALLVGPPLLTRSTK